MLSLLYLYLINFAHDPVHIVPHNPVFTHISYTAHVSLLFESCIKYLLNKVNEIDVLVIVNSLLSI